MRVQQVNTQNNTYFGNRAVFTSKNTGHISVLAGMISESTNREFGNLSSGA